MSDVALNVDVMWRQNGRPAAAKFQGGHGITALIGPSGAGKTTLARLIAGLDTPRGGIVSLNNKVLFHGAKNRKLPVEERDIGFVFQSSALMPHLSVRKNVAFSTRADQQSVDRAMVVTGVQPYADKEVNGLSGGESKRVAIARAIASKPKLLILDEPFNGFDGNARADLMSVIQEINRVVGVPVLLITHQLDEILQLADDAILIADGKTLAYGPLENILLEETSLKTVGFSDAGTLLRGNITVCENSLCTLEVDGDAFYLTNTNLKVGDAIVVRVLAADIALAANKVPGTSILNQIEGTVSGIRVADSYADVSVKLASSGTIMRSRVSLASYTALNLVEGQSITLLIKAMSVKEMLTPSEAL